MPAPPPRFDDPALLPRFVALEALLRSLAPYWQPQPFKEARPAWSVALPQLAADLLALSDDGCAALAADDALLWGWLAPYLPAFAQLPALVQLPLSQIESESPAPRLDWAVPGRKWQQILAFSHAIEPGPAPLLEWCGGKGHLGRLLAARGAQPVTTLELDAALCREGARLAERAGVAQAFRIEDVLAAPAAALGGWHPIALHACGELHRTLVRSAVSDGAAALDLAPCCYAVGAGPHYKPFNAAATLRLTRDDLRLAVTETATASAREVRWRDREMAWKLAFVAWRAQSTGEGYRSMRPIDKAWLRLEFDEFCSRLAQREGLAAQAPSAWQAWEAVGQQRQRDVVRLSLPRQAVRRALELWLVYDLALYLREHGYRVSVAQFCDRTVTPRNIHLAARR